MAARSFVKRLVADQRGATAIEYGLICGLIFLAIVTGVTAFGNDTTSMMNRIANAVSAAG
jgi:pilus assembly protein Flp/PilA